jgi:serine protease
MADGPLRRLRLFVLLSLASVSTLPAAGCGGGGGGGGGGAGGGGGDEGVIAGTVAIDDGDFGILLEREPNGSVAQAQLLPPLSPGERVVLAGNGGASAARYGAVDAVDAFRTTALEAQDVELTLTASTDGLAQGDFDLAVSDTTSGNPIASAATASNPEQVSFSVAKGQTFDVVVTCASGAGAWTLLWEATDPAVPGLLPPAAGAPPPLEAVLYALGEPEVVPGRVVVRARGTGEAEAARVAALVGGRVTATTGGGSLVVEFAPRFADAGGRDALARAARVGRAAGIAFAEPDPVVRALALPNDPHLQRQWGLFGIGAPSAWDVTTGSASVTIGVADTGIAAHPDLDAQRVPGYDFVSDPANGGDGDGRDADPTDPGDGGGADGGSAFHGTHVAGIAGARQGDAYGISGVAPGCRLMPLRAVGVQGGTASDLADAIRYAGGLLAPSGASALPAPLPVLNVSLGTPVPSQELEDACDAAAAAGTLIVAATGNSADPVLFPAAYANVLAVGAVDSRLLYAGYSNKGPQVDLVAPGGNDNRERDGDGTLDGVLSTVRDDRVTPSRPGEAVYVGTSMASPHVAGAAALLLSVDPTLTVAQVRALLVSTARDLGVAGVDDETGAGLLQVGEAVRQALAGLGTPRGDPPRLLLGTTSLRFRSTDTLWSVSTTNAGGGTLHVEGALVSTDSGFPWVNAFLSSAPVGAACDALQVNVSIDPVVRLLLPAGVHAGEVRLFDGASVLGVVRVALEVGPFPLPGQPVSVVAQDATTGQVRASAVAEPLEGFRFALRGLPPGDYVVHAGTDLDADGFFCETPDWCGDYGGAVPATVPVGPGEWVDGIDFRVSR